MWLSLIVAYCVLFVVDCCWCGMFVVDVDVVGVDVASCCHYCSCCVMFVCCAVDRHCLSFAIADCGG